MNLKTADHFGTIETGMEDFNEYISASNIALSTIEQSLTVEVSEEGLIDIFKSVVGIHKGLTEKFSGLMASAKQQYKTEFAIWDKKEHKTISAVEKLQSDLVGDIKVDIPTGMNASYPEVTELLFNFFKEFNSGARMDLISKTIDQIVSSISKESDGHEQAVVVTNNIISATSTKLGKISAMLDKSFDIKSKAMQKKLFSEGVGDIDNLRSVRIGLLKLDDNISYINVLKEHATEVERTIGICITYITDRIKGDDGYVPSKKFIKDFIDLIKNIDSLYSMFGQAVFKTLALQHNITFVYAAVYTESK